MKLSLTLLSAGVISTLAFDDCRQCISNALSSSTPDCSSFEEMFTSIELCFDDTCRLSKTGMTKLEAAKADATANCALFSIEHYPKVECALCVREKFEEISSDEPADSRCDTLENLLEATGECDSAVCRLTDLSELQEEIQSKLEKLKSRLGDDCKRETSSERSECRSCVQTALSPFRSADLANKCSLASETISSIESCQDESCEDIIYPVLRGIRRVVEEVTESDANCDFTLPDTPAYECYECVHEAFNGTRSQSDSVEDRCESFGQLQDALDTCRETEACVLAPAALELKNTRMGKSMKRLKEKCSAENKACEECVEDLQESVKELREKTQAERCEALPALLEDKASCIESCGNRKGNKLARPLLAINRLVRRCNMTP